MPPAPSTEAPEAPPPDLDRAATPEAAMLLVLLQAATTQGIRATAEAALAEFSRGAAAASYLAIGRALGISHDLVAIVRARGLRRPAVQPACARVSALPPQNGECGDVEKLREALKHGALVVARRAAVDPMQPARHAWPLPPAARGRHDEGAGRVVREGRRARGIHQPASKVPCTRNDDTNHEEFGSARAGLQGRMFMCDAPGPKGEHAYAWGGR